MRCGKNRTLFDFLPARQITRAGSAYLSGFDHCSYFVDLRQSNMFLAEMMHHLLEFIQNGQHSIVYINIGIIPIAVTVASETPHAAWKAAHDGTFCSSWLFIRAYLVVYVQAWFERFEMAWHPIFLVQLYLVLLDLALHQCLQVRCQ